MSYEFIGSERLKGFMNGIAKNTNQAYTIHTEFPHQLSRNIDMFGDVVFIGSPSQICDRQDYWDLVNSIGRHDQFCAAVLRDGYSLPRQNESIDCIVRSGSRDKNTHVPFDVMADKLNRFFKSMRS